MLALLHFILLGCQQSKSSTASSHLLARSTEPLRILRSTPTSRQKSDPIILACPERTRFLEVSCSEDSTIGASIRGGTGPATDKITVREASATLRPIIEDAERNKQLVVIKMDCEGSEFAIMEGLDRANLLSRINVFMIEWHKWWSADKSNEDLARPLLANGFAVFDFLRVNAPSASMLFAARTPAASTGASKSNRSNKFFSGRPWKPRAWRI